MSLKQLPDYPSGYGSDLPPMQPRFYLRCRHMGCFVATERVAEFSPGTRVSSHSMATETPRFVSNERGIRGVPMISTHVKKNIK